ncbi:MAG: hypothetical protein ACTSRS_22280 [Candidatus Helarchaeota archaeon]
MLTDANSFKRADPEAGIGHRSDKRHFYGYWELFAVGTKSEMIRLPPFTSPGNKHQGFFDTKEIHQRSWMTSINCL